MGEVWRARDSKLGREVSIKTLPDEFAQDEERLARFEREAKLLASLNHPNIATIHGLEEDKGTRFLVLELVEGDTLAEFLAAGPLPVESALNIALQVAEGLEAAHEEGVIHRDLKPANIKVTPEGKVKVLDFGLAKAFRPMSDDDLSQLPTVTTMPTAAGVILGTPAYMSPEQAKGRAVDKRADVWAFGCVLYEMLTGRRAFPGGDVSETLVAVFTSEVDLDRLPASTPERLRQVLRTCLQKDTSRRARDIGDVRLAMEGAFESPLAFPDAVSKGGSTRTWLAISLTVAVVALAVGVLFGRAFFRDPDAAPVLGLTRLSLNVEPGQHLSGGSWLEAAVGLQRPSRSSFVLSPDGLNLVYVASDGETTRLYRRRLDQAQATPIPESEGASSAFFAPDGESVGFVVELPREGGQFAGPLPGGPSAGAELKRMSMESGEVRTIATSGGEFAPLGASWTERDTILLSSGEAIYEVPANGGSLSPLTSLESAESARLMYPELLPGGQAVLFNRAVGVVPSEWDIVVESLDTGRRNVVVEGGSDPRYIPSGHIVFVRTGSLMAVPFAVPRLEVTGAPVVVVEDVMHAERAINTQMSTGAGQFSVSRSGLLAYVPGGIYPANEFQLVWVDRDGASELLPVPPGTYRHMRFSPDGTRLAYAEGSFGDMQIWVYDIDLEVPVRLTAAGEDNASPVWSPDSTQLAFSTQVGSTYGLLLMASDGSGEPQRLTESDVLQRVSSWSPDGVLTFVQDAADIRTVAVDGSTEPEPFLETSSIERWPAFSPDGRWLAYASDETGRFEVYVRPFPDGEPVRRISTAGGTAPLWSSDGQQLLFRAFDESGPIGIMVVDANTDTAFTESPRMLFESREFASGSPVRYYDLAPDGQRFVMLMAFQVEQQPVTSISVVLNWFQELKERVPAN